MKFKCTREDMEKLPIDDLGVTCDIPGCSQPAVYNCYGVDVCQSCYERIEAEIREDTEEEWYPLTDEDWLLVGREP